MKILDILREEQQDTEGGVSDITIPHRSSKTYGIESMRTKANYKRGTLGSGAQATAHDHPNDPTKIVKYVDLWKSNPASEPYVQWINLVMKNQNNPFFPRVFNAKTIRHKDTGSTTLVVVMEKLQPLADMWNANEKLQHAANEMIKRLGVDVADPSGDAFEFNHYMRDANRRQELRSKTKNPQFKEALALMEPLFRKHGTDLHNENIMVRLTGVGPQLVFVDPLQLPEVDPDQVGL